MNKASHLEICQCWCLIYLRLQLLLGESRCLVFTSSSCSIDANKLHKTLRFYHETRTPHSIFIAGTAKEWSQHAPHVFCGGWSYFCCSNWVYHQEVILLKHKIMGLLHVQGTSLWSTTTIHQKWTMCSSSLVLFVFHNYGEILCRPCWFIVFWIEISVRCGSCKIIWMWSQTCLNRLFFPSVAWEFFF